ncbi:MAG TPA: RsiV family protein [Pyrinomonadaceae bacterium]|nr:RsiV family protein [Pyrinomonadaceae bacterium]
MNSRPKFLLPASLVAAALACAACGGRPQERQAADTAALVAAPAQLLAPEAPAAGAARRAFTPVVAPGEGLELADGSIRERDEKQRYEIDLTFPQLKGRPGATADKFNRAVRALVAGEVRDFRQSYVEAKGRRAPGAAGGDETFDSLTGRHEVIHFADDLASLRLTLHAYGRGGRVIQHHRVLNIDLKSGRALKLGDLFTPEAGHLQALAAHCVADLRRQDEEEYRKAVGDATGRGLPASSAGIRTPASEFEIGAAPTAENYRAWNLSAEGVVVSFAACQVLSCAAGEKEVLVPFHALDAILDQSGPAARLFTRQPR